MIISDPYFQPLTFFTLGFLCIVGCIALQLSLFFKSKIYYYYSGYIAFVLIFIACAYCKVANYLPKASYSYTLLKLVIDASQMIGSFMFGAFIYYALVLEDSKFKKLKFVFQYYLGFTVLYLLTIVFFPQFVLNSIPYFIVSRIIVLLVALLFYYYVIKELKKKYFRYLFLGISFLFLFGFLAFWDSLTNYYLSNNLGFEYLCLGYVLENMCFASAFIFKYFSTEQKNIDNEIRHEFQLSIVKLEMQQETMKQIGREIHDNIGQKLTLASLYTQQLAFENKAPLIKPNIDNISSIINQSLNELRQLSKSLTDNRTKNNTINQLLQQECDNFNELKKCELIFNSNFENFKLPYYSKIILLRITQEFIQNSIKHADCTNITIALNHRNNSILQLLLQDDGKGFDYAHYKTEGIGLKNIKERIKVIDGTYELVSTQKGTILTIEIVL